MRRTRHHSPTRPHTLSEQLLHLARRYATVEASELDELVIGPAQHALLDLVVAEPGISMSVAADYLDVDRAALSRTARRLVRNGLVVRKPSRSDARRQSSISARRKLDRSTIHKNHTAERAPGPPNIPVTALLQQSPAERGGWRRGGSRMAPTQN